MARSDGNYLVIRGYVDGTIQGERSFDTQQEAEYYGKQMLAYIKKMNPKAKKVTVDIDSMTNHSPGPKIKTLASRPGSPDTFAVEDRFYFGKGRKERFAEPREIEAKIRAWIDSRGLPIGLKETNALSYIAAQHMLRGGVSIEQAVKSAARRHAQIGLASAGLRTWLEENA